MALKLSAPTPFSASALGLVILVVVAVSASAAAAASDCTGALMSMMPCLDYITDLKAKAPLPSCCLEVGQVLDSQPLCLCHILNGDVSKLIGRPINTSRTLALPGLCNLSTPPISECKLTMKFLFLQE
ncbi:Non-specific lipid transfer protein GPI-anchored 2 [Ananas comosus]|uniref:Non-specific lipid transfer protein GPI-anchored 2 n=1 Tax=Ananas comosus TaxID=4615 RepID=A0A199UVX7_ANACO|nr:Non-specific lipid transfer protein GPI-anchored 2 [Ananas comosus]